MNPSQSDVPYRGYSNFTAIDFETANPSLTSACSIGLVRVENGQVIDSYYSLLKPFPFEFGHFQTRKHGITPEMVSNAPEFKDIWPSISSWIQDQVIVAHQITFDKNVLHNLFELYSIQAAPRDYLCSLKLAKTEFYQLKDYSLPTVYKVLSGNEFTGHHNALEDAKACAEIVLKILSNWRPPGFETMIEAFYDAKPAVRTNVYGKVKFRELVPDEQYKHREELKGSCFVFTGTIANLTKEEAAKFVVNRGGKVTDSTTKATTQIVVGGFETMDLSKDNLSSKLKRAMQLIEEGQEITILSDRQFLKLIELLK